MTNSGQRLMNARVDRTLQNSKDANESFGSFPNDV
jgi:hypothetical protein